MLVERRAFHSIPITVNYIAISVNGTSNLKKGRHTICSVNEALVVFSTKFHMQSSVLKPNTLIIIQNSFQTYIVR